MVRVHVHVHTNTLIQNVFTGIFVFIFKMFLVCALGSLYQSMVFVFQIIYVDLFFFNVEIQHFQTPAFLKQ